MLRVNLGCGQNKMPGYVNVDKYPSFSPEVVWDLETFPWPFDDSSIGEMVLNHVLEHLGERVDTFLAIMKELYRVAAPGAEITINVPHPRSDGFASDPTHVREVTPAILSLFSKAKNREWKEKGWPNTPLATYLDVDFEIVDTQFSLTPYWAQRQASGSVTPAELELAFASYNNVVDEIRMKLKAIK